VYIISIMIKDIKNINFEFIKVIYKTDKRTKAGNVIWETLCCCGKKLFWTKRQITRYKSCGCKRIELHRRKVWKGCGEISGEFFSSIRKNARDRKLEFGITVQDIWDIFLKQDRKCALTGFELKFGNKRLKEETTASLDRIDSSKGYSVNNIQWLHKKVNFMKQQFNQNDFIEWCGRVFNFNNHF